MKILMRADTHVNIEIPSNVPVAKCTPNQVLAALVVSLASMFVGFSTSYTSPALASMKEGPTPFTVDDSVASWIGSILPLAALFGGLSGGTCITYLGRRNTILFSGVPFIAAQLLITMAVNVPMILIGRAICGFCVGIVSLALPVYLAETLQPEVRGTLGIFPTTFGNVGILTGSTIGMYLNWSNLALTGIAMPATYLVFMCLIPETPRWFISKGKTKKAGKSLQWLRGKKTDITDELNAIEKVHLDSEKVESRPMDLFTGNNLKPLLVSLGLMLFQQMSGINAIIFYTVSIFKASGSDMDEHLSSTIVTGVNLCSTFIATFLIDRLGRKILLYISSVLMTVSLLVLGYYFHAKDQTDSPVMMDFVKNYNYLPLVSLVAYVIGFSIGFGPIPWLMMGEILPAKVRGTAASLTTAFNWTCTFLVTKFFDDICKKIGSDWTFWGFACICFVGLIFTVISVPETSGRSLEEIENRLTGPVRRMSAVANMKPMPTAC